MGLYETQEANYEYRKSMRESYNEGYEAGYEKGRKDAAPKWTPVTPDTMPEKNRVVVVCGEKGTWDFGTYRGHCSSIHLWIWKKNTLKTVYWWMYKDDALPPQPKGE